jgi:hypothetical protein
MKVSKFLMIVSIVCVLFGLSSAQNQPSSAPQRDVRALRILSGSIAKMTAAPDALQSVSLNGRFVPSNGDSTRSFKTVYQVKGRRTAFVKQVSSANGTSTLASGRGRPLHTSENGRSQRFSDHVAIAAQPFDFPVLIFTTAIRDQGFSIALVGDVSPNIPVHIRIEDETDVVSRAVTTQNWFFDPTTLVPIRVEYKVPNVANAADSEPATCDFLSFQAVDGVLVPRELRIFEGGTEAAHEFVDTVDLNTAVSPDFDMPEGGC